MLITATNRWPQFLAMLVLAMGMLFVHPQLQAGEIDWQAIERVLDYPRADKLIDDRRTRRIDIDPPRQQQKRTMRFSLDYAVSKVRREYNGKVIGARTSWRGDEAIHKIKLRTEDGRIRTIYVSGTTGR